MSDIKSIRTKNIDFPKRKTLESDIITDALVIGGGLCGVLTARFLSDCGIRTVLLEANTIASGQSSGTTAKITAQHGPIYHKLIKYFGKKKALLYAEANRLAIEEYRKIIRNNNIECDFTDAPAYLYSTREGEELRLEFTAAKALGFDASITRETELPFDVRDALCFNGQAMFHPLKFISAVTDGLEIYENSMVLKVEKGIAKTERGSVKAKNIVFCSHYPFINFPGFFFLKMHQERSYVLMLEKVQEMRGMYLGIDGAKLSFRSYGQAMLLGGGGHRTGENPEGRKYSKLRKYAGMYFPQGKEAGYWSAQDCMTPDGIPYIGRFSKGMYVATGFNKWGMTSSMVSAMLIKDLVTKGESKYEGVYSPGRFDLAASAKEMSVHIAKTVKGLGKRIIPSESDSAASLLPGQAKIMEYNGRKMGIYKDENGKIYKVPARCPHLGCQLEWNADEKSWDCPCHGSRFDYRGALIDGPAQKSCCQKR